MKWQISYLFLVYEHRKKLIADHDNGVRNPTCSTCWDAEDAGIKSPRQKFNEELRDVEVNDVELIDPSRNYELNVFNKKITENGSPY